MTPQDFIPDPSNSPEPESPDDCSSENEVTGMKELVQSRRVNLLQRELSHWAAPRTRPDRLDVSDMRCFLIQKICPKDRYHVDTSARNTLPTPPHRRHIRIKSGTDGKKYMPAEGPPKVRQVKSALAGSTNWQSYNALNRPTAPDPIPQLYTHSVERERGKKEEHLQQWRNQVVKQVLIKRQKYSVPIDPTAPRTSPSIHNSRHSAKGGKTPSRPASVSTVTSSHAAVIGVPSYWKNTKPKYRSHLQGWKFKL